jgi:hypothetical protein
MMKGEMPAIGSNTASEVKKFRTERMNSRSMDYKTCSGTPSALGDVLTSCPTTAFGPTVFDCLDGLVAKPIQPKDAPHATV